VQLHIFCIRRDKLQSLSNLSQNCCSIQNTSCCKISTIDLFVFDLQIYINCCVPIDTINLADISEIPRINNHRMDWYWQKPQMISFAFDYSVELRLADIIMRFLILLTLRSFWPLIRCNANFDVVLPRHQFLRPPLRFMPLKRARAR